MTDCGWKVIDHFQRFLIDLIEIKPGGNPGHTPYHVGLGGRLGGKSIVHVESTSKNILNYNCPWLCYFHGIYYQKDDVSYKNKKFPYYNVNCKSCIMAGKTYENWIKDCKEKAIKANVKHTVWNIYKGLLAADLENKVYYFTKNKNDKNLIFHFQLSSELLDKYEEKINDKLVWYVL